MRLLDTNIIIRYLTNDDPVKAEACRRLIHAIHSGQEQVQTTESVIAEVVYILSSSKHYHLSHTDVVTNLAPIVQLRRLAIPRKRIIVRALALYRRYTHLDFEDCLNVATVERDTDPEIVSYDRGFDKVPEVRRREP